MYKLDLRLPVPRGHSRELRARFSLPDFHRLSFPSSSPLSPSRQPLGPPLARGLFFPALLLNLSASCSILSRCVDQVYDKSDTFVFLGNIVFFKYIVEEPVGIKNVFRNLKISPTTSCDVGCIWNRRSRTLWRFSLQVTVFTRYILWCWKIVHNNI